MVFRSRIGILIIVMAAGLRVNAAEPAAAAQD
jgi:hypothetical protein